MYQLDLLALQAAFFKSSLIYQGEQQHSDAQHLIFPDRLHCPGKILNFITAFHHIVWLEQIFKPWSAQNAKASQQRYKSYLSPAFVWKTVKKRPRSNWPLHFLKKDPCIFHELLTTL